MAVEIGSHEVSLLRKGVAKNMQEAGVMAQAQRSEPDLGSGDAGGPVMDRGHQFAQVRQEHSEAHPRELRQEGV